MRARITHTFALIAFIPALASPAWSQNSGAAFLRIDTGARPAALGGAYTAIADDVHALHYNPAGLSTIGRREVGLSHAQWLLGSRFDFLGYAHPTWLGTLGIGLTRLAAGELEGRDYSRRGSGSFGAAHSAYAVGLGHNVHTPIGSGRLGASVKLLESRIGSDTASSLAVDLGAAYQLPGRPFSFGLSVLNLGQGMRFIEQTDPLPLTISLGAAYRAAGVFRISVDLRRDIHDQTTDAGIGTEYAILPAFSVRLGYGSHLARVGTGPSPAFSGLGGGIGLSMSRYQADYTFMPFGNLGNVQRISLGARF